VRALLDTSFFVAAESGRPVRQVPEDVDETEVSVVTVAELTLGVLLARDEDRPVRLGTLAAVETTWDPLGIDVEVAREFARITAELRRRGRRAPILDVLLAATAITEGIPVVTQDRDYGAIAGLRVIQV